MNASLVAFCHRELLSMCNQLQRLGGAYPIRPKSFPQTSREKQTLCTIVEQRNTNSSTNATKSCSQRCSAAAPKTNTTAIKKCTSHIDDNKDTNHMHVVTSTAHDSPSIVHPVNNHALLLSALHWIYAQSLTHESALA